VALVAHFLVSNLLFSLAAGLLAWLVAWVMVRLLELRSSSPFLLLQLTGVQIAPCSGRDWNDFPWPTPWLDSFQRQALPAGPVVLSRLAWAAGVYLIYLLVVRKARQFALRGAAPAAEAAPRLAANFETVVEGFRKVPCPSCSDDLCCTVELKSRPRLLVSRHISSPLAMTDGGEPIILFPEGLLSRLNDAELAGALAHEVAHFHLRRPSWCSAGTLQKLTWVSPVAGLLGTYLQRQEEKACDELAVSVVGQPEVYAGMLTKSYRYAREQDNPANSFQLSVLPRLLGFKPLLSERVEHLLRSEHVPKGWKQSRLVLWLAWIVLFSILFFGFSTLPS
jgi:Zn-dependent protease with chaperone function